MRVGLITTASTNIGDDLIRVGVERLLRQLLGAHEPDFNAWNKHAPWTYYKPWTPVKRLIAGLPRGRRLATTALRTFSRAADTRTVADDVDLVVQAGTPVVWPGMASSEWQVPLWRDVLRRRDFRAPVIGVAGGSAFPWVLRDAAELDSKDLQALHEIAGVARVLTVRDGLARSIFNLADVDPSVLPCTAMHAGAGQLADPGSDKAMLNIMPRGGHFLWGQAIDPIAWLAVVDRVVEQLSKDFEVTFVCHSNDELDLARDRWPSHAAVLPRTTDEYLATCRQMAFGVVNRMHAAVALAGVGVPAVAIGADTRLLMVEETGQEIIYLGDAEADLVMDRVEKLVDTRDWRRERLSSLEARAFAAHLEVVRSSRVLEGIE